LKEIQMLADLFGIDTPIVILVVVVVLFGGSVIPKLARGLGSAKTEFEKGLEEGKKSEPGGTAAAATNGTAAAVETPAPAPAPAPAPSPAAEEPTTGN
jgi:sec-independent protein translocase protein TatA